MSTAESCAEVTLLREGGVTSVSPVQPGGDARLSTKQAWIDRSNNHAISPLDHFFSQVLPPSALLQSSLLLVEITISAGALASPRTLPVRLPRTSRLRRSM